MKVDDRIPLYTRKQITAFHCRINSWEWDNVVQSFSFWDYSMLRIAIMDQSGADMTPLYQLPYAMYK